MPDVLANVRPLEVGDRVRVISATNLSPVDAWGNVVRASDVGAFWVELDARCELPTAHPFSAGHQCERWVLAWPHSCVRAREV